MITLLVALFVSLFDQISKIIFSSTLHLNESISVIPNFFNLTLIYNQGAAFGILQKKWFLLIFLSVMSFVVLVYFYKIYAQNNKYIQILLGLIMGGAFGNLMDRVRFEYVVDFLDFYIGSYHWPAFNIADSCISIGVILFTVWMLFIHENKQIMKKESEEK